MAWETEKPLICQTVGDNSAKPGLTVEKFETIGGVRRFYRIAHKVTFKTWLAISIVEDAGEVSILQYTRPPLCSRIF
jgi:hypothetical protein